MKNNLIYKFLVVGFFILLWSANIFAAPTAPSGLAATPNGSTIRLTWTDNSNNETSFIIERSTDNVTFVRVNGVSANRTIYIDSYLASRTWYYRIAARGSDNSLSTYSAVAWATTQAASFSQSWVFNNTTSSSYTVSGSSNYRYTASVLELTQASQTDSSTTNFTDGTYTGSATYDSTNSYVRLNTSTPDLELSSNWTPAWANLIGYWKMNNDWNDSISSNHGTASGGATFTSSSVLGSHAGSFDGTGSVSVADNASFNVVNKITVMAWVKGAAQDNRGIVAQYDVTANQRAWQMQASNTNWGFGTDKLGVIISDDGTVNNGHRKAYASKTVVFDNTWKHICFTFNAGTFRIYVNGMLESSPNINADDGITTILNSTANLTIGSLLSSGVASNNFTGSIDDIAIWNVALPASAIATIYQHESAKYAGTFTSRVIDGFNSSNSWTNFTWTPTLPYLKSLPDAASNETTSNYSSLNSNSLLSNLVGLWHLDETAATGSGSNDYKDNSGNNNYGEAAGGTTFGVSSILNRASAFNGTTGYVNLGHPAALDSVTNGSFTFSTWVNVTQFPTATCAVNSSTCQSGVLMRPGNHMGLSVYNSGTFICNIYNNSGTYFGTSGAQTAGVWHHFAMIVDSTNKKLYCLVDGKQIGSSPVTYTGTLQNYAGTDYTIGVGNPAYGLTNGSYAWFLNGAVDEVAIWSRALSTSEILQLYRRGANRIRYQIRSCNDNACSGESWQGPDNTDQTYFSELYNTTNNSLTGAISNGLPTMTFSNFSGTGLSVSTDRYFQYRAMMESDDNNSLCNYGGGAAPCSPEIVNASVGPTHYDSAGATVINNTGATYSSLTGFTETLGSSGCASGGGLKYVLSPNGTNWYWYNAGAWASSTGLYAQATAASALTAGVMGNFASQVSSGNLFFKAFLTSDGTQPCQLGNLSLTGNR